VHAFTDAGKVINFMILFMLLFFVLGSFTFYFIRQSGIPNVVKEEEISSREFWMFTGSLVLFMSGIFVIIVTSVPVFNKIPGFLKTIFIFKENYQISDYLFSEIRSRSFFYKCIISSLPLLITLLNLLHTKRKGQILSRSSIYIPISILLLTALSFLIQILLHSNQPSAQTIIFGLTDIYFKIRIFELLIIFVILGLFYVIYKNTSTLIKSIKKIKELTATSLNTFYFQISLSIFLLLFSLSILVTLIMQINGILNISEFSNKLHSIALPEDPEYLYNKVMIMVAMILGLITGASQFLKYKKTEIKISTLALPIIVSLMVSFLLSWAYPLQFISKGNGFLWSLYFGLFSMIYTVVANGIYIATGFKFKMKLAGSSLAHIGFGLMIGGMIISSANKKVISDSSVNHINIDMGQDPMTKKKENSKENLTLVRDVPTAMGNYIVTYTGNSKNEKEKTRSHFTMHFEELNSVNGNSVGSFDLRPDVYLMKNNGMSSNPDTKHYLNRDIFTYISAVPNQDESNVPEYNPIVLKKGEKVPLQNAGYFILDSVSYNPQALDGAIQNGDSLFIANITFVLLDSSKYTLHPAIMLNQGVKTMSFSDSIKALDLSVNISNINNGIVKLGVTEKNPVTDFITVKTYIFPYINLVWLGLIIMALGIFMSMLHRAGIKGSSWIFLFTCFALGIIYMFLFAR